MKRSYIAAIYALYTGIMPILTSGIIISWLIAHQNTIVKGSMYQMVLAGILSIFLAGLAIVPTSILAIIFGFLFGLSALLVLIPAYLLATILGYFIGKIIDGNSIIYLINENPKAQKFLGRLQAEQFKIVALSRLSPVFPFGISNVIFTYLAVPLRILLGAGLLGMLPRTVALVWVGSQAQNLWYTIQNGGNLNQAFIGVGLIATLAILWLIVKIWRKI